MNQSRRVSGGLVNDCSRFATVASQLAGDLQIDRLRPLAALVRLGFEGYPHSVAQCRYAGTLYGSDVDEYILAPVVRRNEPISLGCIEEFNGAVLAHRVAFSIQLHIRRLPSARNEQLFRYRRKDSCA